MFARQFYDIVCISETWSGIEDSYEPQYIRPDGAYMAYLDGHSTRTTSEHGHRQGVGILVRQGVVNESVEHVNRFSARIMSIQGRFHGEDLMIFSIYAPDASYEVQDTELFYKQLSQCTREGGKIQNGRFKGKIVILGDFNAQVGITEVEHGEESGAYDDIRGRCLKNEHISPNGNHLLQFCIEDNEHDEFTIANTMFDNEYPGTYINRNNECNITLDHLLVSTKLYDEGNILDAGVTRNNYMMTRKESDHRVSELRIKKSVEKVRIERKETAAKGRGPPRKIEEKC
jgi:hypothetical protein